MNVKNAGAVIYLALGIDTTARRSETGSSLARRIIVRRLFSCPGRSEHYQQLIKSE